MNEWGRNLDELREFINQRCSFLNDNAMECHGEVEGQYELTLISEPENVGRIDLNTLRLEEFPWTGSYFGNMDNLIDVKVQDEFKNEYIFSHWESKSGNDISPTDMDKDIRYRLSMPDTLIAHFKVFDDSNTSTSNIVINEFMASNQNTAADQDGDFDDWIELYNKGNEDVDISGFYLSDDVQNLAKYEIPNNTILASDEYLIIWADEDGSQDDYHANFKLSRSGETIFLLDSDTTIIDRITYVNQEIDVSNARKPNGTGGFKTGTPTFNSYNGGATSTKDILAIDDKLIAYPNPTNGKVTIQLKRNGHALENVVVRDLLGHKVISLPEVNQKQLIMDVSHLVPGFYLITANDLYTTKVLIQ